MSNVVQLREAPLQSSNPSGYLPLGHAVLTRPIIRHADSVIYIPPEARKRFIILEEEVEVVAVGPSAWADEPFQRAKPGDHVLVTFAAGKMLMGKDDQQYRMVNANDIFCLVDPNYIPAAKVEVSSNG